MAHSTHGFPRGRAALLDRRGLLAWGGLCCLGGVLPRLSGQESVTPRRPAIRSCILVFHYGGPSHLDTFDPKPDAPDGIRGAYKTIQTAVPGVSVCEHLPRLARVMDRVTLVRSMHHRMTNHNAAASEGLTGRPPAGGDLELLADEARAFPTLGSTVAFGLGAHAHVLPYVALPYTIYNVVQIPGQTAGFLGAAYDRFQVSGDPNAADFRVSSLQLPDGRRPADLARRQELLRHFDARSDSDQAAKMRGLQERSLEVVTSDAVRHAFDISQETPLVRDRYGRTLLGQSLLLARRLVESGVNFVTVFDGQTNGQDANWDSHQKVFERHRQLIPPTDRGVAALIEDLHARGLLASTLVVSVGEFGRTPKINKDVGRDHWPHCYSALLAGGGVQGGGVYGASDKTGAAPARDPVAPADLVATILWRFGIDPAREVQDQTARPYRLATGEPLTCLF